MNGDRMLSLKRKLNYQEQKDLLQTDQVLLAIANWMVLNDEVSVKKLMNKWRFYKNTGKTSKHEFNPLLTLVIKCNDDVRQVDENGRTILHLCLDRMKQESNCNVTEKKKDFTIVKFLCEMGASVIANDHNGVNPLRIAFRKNRMDLVEIMVRLSIAKLNDCNSEGDTILHILIDSYSHNGSDDYNRFLTVIDLILSKGGVFNKLNKNGLAAIHLIVKSCYLDILKKFIKYGADVNIKTSSGDTLLILACKNMNNYSYKSGGIFKWIDCLLKLGCRVNFQNDCGFTALHYASQASELRLVKILVKAGSDIHAVTVDGSTPLDLAGNNAQFSNIMYYFIELGAKFNRRNILHGIALMGGMDNHTDNDEKAIEWMIKYGFDKHEKGDLTLLHLAAAMGRIRIVKILIERRADVNFKDDIYKYTPLHLASIRRQFTTVPELCEARFSNNIINSNVKYKADQHQIDYESTILTLLRAGANINAKDRCRRTPLHYAARHTHKNDLIALLLKFGARVDDVDAEGYTPLHNSLLSANRDGLMHLLSFGADINDIEHLSQDIWNQIKQLNWYSSALRKYLIKLEVAGLPINDIYKSFFEDGIEPLVYNYYSREVKDLKKHMLTSNVSLFDWLHMNTNRRFASITSLPTNVQDKFEYYDIVIQCLRYQAINRKQLIGRAKMVLRLLTDGLLVDLCLEYILSFCSNSNLNVLIDSINERKF